MDLRETQDHWTQLGRDDPFWAVLTDPNKRGGRWDPKEFFQTGVDEINGVLGNLESRKVKVLKGKALDFGCGVGRLSQALAKHFDEVHGVDISPSMLEHANRFNQFGTKCAYHLNGASDLRIFPDGSFDFVYTAIVLQHMQPQYQKGYITEFFRVLKPGGVIEFQVISGKGWRQFIPDSLVTVYRKWRHGEKAYISMFGLKETELAGLFQRGGMEVIDLRRCLDDTGRWLALRYIARKKQSFTVI